MSYTEVWLFSEGDDDHRFLEHLIVPLLEREYTCVTHYDYAQTSPPKVAKFLSHLQHQGIDYIFFGDIDSHPCITLCKQRLEERYGVPDLENIIIVVREIESWYLAGIDCKRRRKLGLQNMPRQTDNLSKEQFNSSTPSKARTRIALKHKILEAFCVSLARKNNRSFRYFTDKYDLCN